MRVIRLPRNPAKLNRTGTRTANGHTWPGRDAEPEFYQVDKLRAAAGAVLTKEPKVESTAIREMREEVKKIIDKGDFD